MANYTRSQFDRTQFSEAQNQAYAVLSAICGPAVAMAFARYYGKDIDPDDVVNAARTYGLWSSQTGMYGPQAQKKLLDTLGIPVEYAPEVNFSALQEKLLQGYTAAVSTPKHYFFLQGYDPATGRFDTGASGEVFKGGGRYLTAQQIQALGGQARGQFVSNAPGGQTPIEQPIAQSTNQQFQMPAWAAGNPYAQMVVDAAVKRGIDPNIFLRQLNQESGLNPRAKNPSGATGIGQLMPFHWQGKFDPYDPAQNINYAADMMAGFLKQYGGDYRKALAAYNAGPGAVQKYGGIPPYQETRTYLEKILGGEPSPSYTPSPNFQTQNNQTQQPQSIFNQPQFAGGLFGRGQIMPLVQMGQQTYTPFGRVNNYSSPTVPPPAAPIGLFGRGRLLA